MDGKWPEPNYEISRMGDGSVELKNGRGEVFVYGAGEFAMSVERGRILGELRREREMAGFCIGPLGDLLNSWEVGVERRRVAGLALMKTLEWLRVNPVPEYGTDFEGEVYEPRSGPGCLDDFQAHMGW